MDTPDGYMSSNMLQNSNFRLPLKLKGVDTNQLLEIRKLEDRQAEEWKALNLPKINNVSKNSTTRSSNTSVKVKRAEFQSTNDPNLEIALALSASMASTTGETIETKSEKVEELKNETVQQCWLPQVSIYPIFF